MPFVPVPLVGPRKSGVRVHSALQNHALTEVDF